MIDRSTKRQRDNLLSPDEAYARAQELARMLAREQAAEKRRVANKRGVQVGKRVNSVPVASGDDRRREGLYQELIEVTDDEAEEMDVDDLLANIDDEP